MLGKNTGRDYAKILIIVMWQGRTVIIKLYPSPSTSFAGGLLCVRDHMKWFPVLTLALL